MIRFISTLAILIAVLTAALFLPVEVPYEISVPGKIVPAREWLLVRSDEGTIGTVLRDNVRGTVDSYNVHQFERGDAVRFRLNPDLQPNGYLTAGDTVGQIFSNETSRRIAELSGRLALASSAVSLYASGEKEAVVARAEKELQRANEQARQQRQEVERLEKLHERKLISDQEIDAARSLLEIYQSEVEIAQAELQTVRTGAKPEQVAFVQTEAEAHRREIEVLKDRLDSFIIQSPISGVAVRSFGSDTLLTLRDNSAYLVVMPLPWRDHGLVSVDQEVRLKTANLSSRLTGRVLQIGDTIQLLRGEQIMMVTALIEAPPQEPLAGGFAECTIRTGDVSLLEYVKRKILS